MSTITSYMQAIQNQDNENRQNKPITIEEDILGVNEALTKLWFATRDKKDVDLRVANVLYGALLLAARLGITDLDGVMNKRIDGLNKIQR